MNIVEKTDEKLVFIMKADDSLANSIRRSIGLIPTMAIEELEVAKNDSALYDETIAHRMGLITLKMDKKWKEGDTIKLKLNSKKEGIVYAEGLKGEAEVVYPKTPITLLKNDQEIKITAIGKMGIGKDHAKFNPGILFYRNVFEITMDNSLEDAVKRILPNFEIKSKGNKIVLKDDQSKSIVDFCEGIAQKEKKDIDVKETDELIFTIESFGQMSAGDIFKNAIAILKKELKDVPKNLK